MLARYHFGPVANSLTPLLCLLENGLAFDNWLARMAERPAVARLEEYRAA